MNYERIIRLSLALVIAATTITASAVLVSAQEATKPEAPVKQARKGGRDPFKRYEPPVKLVKANETRGAADSSSHRALSRAEIGCRGRACAAAKADDGAAYQRDASYRNLPHAARLGGDDRSDSHQTLLRNLSRRGLL